jgi:cytidylate kinase
VGELIVVTGPPGAGKSSVARLLADQLERSAWVAGDDFFGFLRRGAIAPWRPEAHAQNTVVIQAAAAAAGVLTGRCDVVYDGVVGPWFLPTFLDGSRLDHLHYAVLLPPLEVCRQRVSSRTGHGFADPDATAHMWREFAQARAERHTLTEVAPPEDIAGWITAGVASGILRHPDAPCS